MGDIKCEGKGYEGTFDRSKVVDEAQQDAGGAAEDGWMFDSDEDGMEIDVVSSEEESEDPEGDEEDL